LGSNALKIAFIVGFARNRYPLRMTLTHDDLIAQLRHQLQFIDASCQAFDRGVKAEGLRIATSLRVLFHDTAKSVSLLKHLQKKSGLHLISTIGLGKTDQQLGKTQIIAMPLMISMHGVTPPLGTDPRPPRILLFDDWWEEIVMAQNHRHSRKSVVLSAANEDGGAHVGIAPKPETVELKEGVGTFTKQIGGGVSITEELTDHHFPLLRQLGYEVLNSPEIVGLV
jgi:hypothetical protein